MAGQSSGRTGRPPITSRADIMAAARRLIDRDGWEKLTIRKLAAEAGVAPTTLYHHIRDKEDLLKQLLDDAADAIERPTLPADPRGRIIAAATVMHAGLSEWPWLAEVLTDGDLTGDSAMWLVETIIAAALDAGCTPPEAVALYRAVWSYTAGEILVRANSARRRAELGGTTYGDALVRSLDPDEYPALAGIAEQWPELTTRDWYAAGLRALVDGTLREVGEG
ncbi:helix-turn-helix domain-containing protein [Phytomonospora sp. NPDC050363]|uniref:TetR/AcrR family transcriptional regulator n=1 Tax=Phytomonospora sp. NPDC050363 TaxID=3155642 RepID=UPI0033C8B12C